MVHGWISNDPLIGFWQITPSDEFRTGGPLKQNLCSHVGPTCLAVSYFNHVVINIIWINLLRVCLIIYVYDRKF